jgi:hypothetical protein
MADHNIKVSGIEQVAEILKTFVDKVIAPPAEEIGQILAENIRLYRLKNEVRIIQRAETYLKEKNIKTKKVSIKTLAPLLIESSLEDDENLQDKWAALLANTVSEGKDFDAPVFSKILSEMTGADAEVFEIIFNHFSSGTPYESISVNTRINANKILSSIKDYKLILDNLVRLRLIREDNPFGSDIVNVALTELGRKFMIACTFS